MAEPPQTQTRAPQVEPEPLPPVVSLAEAAHLDPAQAPALQGTGSWDGASMSIVVPYDPTWPQRFQAASAELLAATDHPFLRLDTPAAPRSPGSPPSQPERLLRQRSPPPSATARTSGHPRAHDHALTECLDAAPGACRRAACSGWPVNALKVLAELQAPP